MRKAFMAKSLVVFSLAGQFAAADVVQINGGRGHGMLFHYGDECLMMLPTHVHSPKPYVSFQGTAPEQRGRATIQEQQIAEMDLSLAAVHKLPAGQCGTAWFDLTQSLAAVRHGPLTLTRVESANTKTNTPMQVLTLTATRIEARVSPGFSDHGIFQGTSGAIAFQQDLPVGMALEAKSEQDASFLKMSKILPAIAEAKGFSLKRPTSKTFYSEIAPVLSPTGETAPKPFGIHVPSSPDIKPIVLEGSINDQND